jgi:hypothetical protein
MGQSVFDSIHVKPPFVTFIVSHISGSSARDVV